MNSTRAILTALSATLVPLFFPAQAAAQSSDGDLESISLQDCALIEDGVKRLACYDTKLAPDEARSHADPQTLEDIEAATDKLNVASEEARNGEQTEADEDKDEGVMTAVMDRYLATEKALFSYSGQFLAHNPTYLMPFTHSFDPNQTPQSPSQSVTRFDSRLDNQEAQFQISFKVPLLTGLFDDRTTLWFGYTQLSFWQVFNEQNSRPFRETNFNPELFTRYQTDFEIGPGVLNHVTLGINHESNGRSDPRSRSWNRITGSASYSYNRWLFILAPWYRIPEDSKDDDNPDIEKFLGYGDLWTVYKMAEDRTLSLKLRNNFRSDDNKTSVQLGYSFPMGDLRGYVQYYNGYGESLIDYNERIHRIGVGIMLNDWL